MSRSVRRGPGGRPAREGRGGHVPGGALPTAASGRLRAWLDAHVPAAMAGAGVPGAALGVLAGGETVMAGYGVTSVEHPLPVDERTLFQIGSVSKTFTATLVMALVEQGRVGLDDPVRRHLPGLRLGGPDVADAVTVRHLLTHTSGCLGDWFLVHPPGLGEGDDALARLVERMADLPQLFPPGTGWSYNNAGFAVAGRLVEVLSGQPYARALRQAILAPLGLDRTFVSADEAITHRVAAPHGPGDGGPRLRRGDGWQPGWQLARADVPLGGLVSCVHDLLGWARFHLGERPAAGRPAPLSCATVAAMQAPQARAGCFADEVGLSWMLRRVEGRRLVLHGGLTSGYATGFTLVPEAGVAVVVLSNATPGGTTLGRELTRRLLREATGLDDAPPRPVPGLGADLAAYTGRYDNPFAVQVVTPGPAEGELVLEQRLREPRPGTWAPAPPGPIRLAFHAGDRVVAVGPADQAGLRGEFGRDAAGRVLWLRWGGRLAPRLPD